MVHLVNIHKSYDKRDILNIPELKLDEGIYWIRGQNGSGKTTLLKIISGLIPFSGDIIYNDVSIKKSPLAYRKQVSWSMAEPVYPEFISGTDLIELYSQIRNTRKSEADELISLFQMSDYINAATGTYSSGMVKKLSLVLALIGKSPLVVLDEPLITLDTGTVDLLCKLIEDWQYRFGISFLLSSHVDVEHSFSTACKEMTVSNQTIAVSA